MNASHSETDPLENDRFVALALQHGLLKQSQADAILARSAKEHLHPSDAALSLSMMQLHEVDAVNLLAKPTELAVGYELQELIGCGAAGMVFRATQANLNRDVALKTINVRSNSPTGDTRLQLEAQAIAKLRHPNIVAAYDSGFHHGRFCIAMEFVEGETVADLIYREAPIEERIVWSIARQVVSALQHASQLGITHRDIKPANLLLCDPPAGQTLGKDVPFVKVVDFGLAFDRSDANESNALTATGITLGTPAFVAPEQLGDTHVDQRADIYSLGATVFNMLSAMPPFVGATPMKTVLSKTIGDDSWRDDLPKSVSSDGTKLFRAMTESDPENRIQDYAEITEKIDAILTAKTSVQTPAFANEVDDELPTSLAIAHSKPAPSLPHKNLPRSLLRPNFLLIGGILFFVAVGMMVLAWSFGGLGSNIQPTQEDWRVDGFARPLFNGQTVPPYEFKGLWLPGQTVDGSRVLVASTGASMTFPGSSKENDPFRFRVSVSADSGDVEINARNRNASESSPIGSVRILQKEAQLTTNASREPLSTRSLPPAKSGPKVSTFRRVAIFKRDGVIRIELNGDLFGVVHCGPTALIDIELRCTGSDASFGDIDVTNLVAINSNGEGE